MFASLERIVVLSKEDLCPARSAPVPLCPKTHHIAPRTQPTTPARSIPIPLRPLLPSRPTARTSPPSAKSAPGQRTVQKARMYNIYRNLHYG
jgi:hypothetical protein